MPYKLKSGVLVYRYGERGSGYRLKAQKALVPQDFQKLRLDCLNYRELFEDPEFPARKSSLGPGFQGHSSVEWKRPHEFLSSPPKFFVGGASRFDVKQGELGNCWLLAAVANLTLSSQLFHLIVPEDNSFADGNYAGIFHFRFWKFGRWVDVVVDDKLPTRNGRLIFMHSIDEQEMWSALLEKAYAKIHGSYDKLIGGEIIEALEDFTGGLSETCKLEDQANADLFPVMMKSFARKSFLGCSIDAEMDEIETEAELGLVKGHAYSITDIKTVVWEASKAGKSKKKRKCVKLLRIRNPWGDSMEWKGPWSDGSKEWEQLNQEVIKQFDITFSADGEFWMSYEDFLQHFHNLDICNLAPDVMDELESIAEEGPAAPPQEKKKRWIMSAYEGSWVKGITAGGCRNHVTTFGMNSQFMVNLVDVDEEDDDDKCTLIVALMQKNRRKLGKDYLNIGFLIYQIKDLDNTPRPLNERFFRKNRSVAGPPDGYSDARDISCRFRLPPGLYCIVPSTYEPNMEGDFILRVFTEQPFSMEENDDEVQIELERLEAEGLQDVDPPSAASELKEAKQFFKKVAGADMEVNWEELQNLLDSAFKLEIKNFQGFSKDLCRSMIAMMDADRSGKLGFEEFQSLWQSVKDWRDVFYKFDADKSGALDASELKNALYSAGFRVNNRILQVLVLRYGNRENSLAFDDFLSCAIKLKAMVEVFQERVADGEKKAMFTLDEWLERSLYS